AAEPRSSSSGAAHFRASRRSKSRDPSARAGTYMRKPVIAGNWKMFKTIAEAVATAGAAARYVEDVTHCEMILAPAFPSLRPVADQLAGTALRVASQDIATEPRWGAFTG